MCQSTMCVKQGNQKDKVTSGILRVSGKGISPQKVESVKKTYNIIIIYICICIY